MVIQKLLFTLKETFVITTDEVEEWVDTAGDSEKDELSSFGDSEEDESSSVGDSEEEETDPRVQEEVGEIFTCSTMAVCNGS